MIREFRHLFASPRRITATIRVDLSKLNFRTAAYNCILCEWNGSKDKQPSLKLYPEFKQWMDLVVSEITTATGSKIMYAFELPQPSKAIELWLYSPGQSPLLIKTLPKPCSKPLAEFPGFQPDSTP